MSTCPILFFESLVLNTMSENEAKLYLKESEKEYKKFLARVIPESTPASFFYALDMIERFMNREKQWEAATNDLNDRMVDWFVKEHGRHYKHG